jgi:isoquinoline 1-oxidoreductase beta subunit
MAKGVGYLAEPARGDVATALAAATTLNATYSLPYVPHVCMEVLNCTVHHRGTSCEIWAPVQAAAWVHDEAVKLTGLSKDAITVHTTFLGGGLGRKIERDYYSQAIQVGIRMQGQPVKLTWSREEDTRFDQFRPTALINVQARLAAGGRIAAWKYRHVSPSISRQRGRSMTSADTQATEGCYALPYAMDASRIEWVENPARVPVGYWRSVGYSLNAFAVESAIDELALAAGIDPMTFRKDLMAASPRPLAVLEMADKCSQWRKTLPSGRAWGMAYGEAFGTHVCQVVEVSGSATSLRVNRVLCVVDCGMAVNPGSVEMQMQGGIIHGLNAAMWGRQKFVAGKPQIANFNTYRMLRVSEAPQVEVQILNSGQPVSGVGEPGVPPIAPAVANAYFRLTGIRKRKLPFFA